MKNKTALELTAWIVIYLHHLIYKELFASFFLLCYLLIFMELAENVLRFIYC